VCQFSDGAGGLLLNWTPVVFIISDTPPLSFISICWA
jgi:hypothetical protein